MNDRSINDPKRDLEAVTASWFLFLTTFRTNVASMNATVDWTRNKLKGLLNEMTQAAAGDLKLKSSFEQAKYPLVYFADEVLLNCGWDHVGEWERKLLESEIFQSQYGGQDFFKRAEDPNLRDPEVIEVFYKCLSLGFAGAYADKPMMLRDMRERLLSRLPVKQQDGTRFCPKAYEHTDRRNFVKLPMVATARIAIATLAFIVVILWASRWTTAGKLETVTEGLQQIQGKNSNPDPWKKLIDLTPGNRSEMDSSSETEMK
ncbi:MAG: DotU family type IV/VI secretion system protein [Planctomycetes bacterium]|nr:DotU family type IV/VI secretion system protein [Planctomycetota bacterium]